MKIFNYAFLALFMISCSGTKPDSIIRNDSFTYETGTPHISISSSGYYNEFNNTIIRVAAELIPSSLITKSQEGENNGNLFAEFEIEYRIYSIDNRKDRLVNYKMQDRVNFSDEISPQLSENVVKVENFEVPSAGDYEINVTITDLVSGKETTSVERVNIPDAQNDGFNISNVDLTALDRDKSGLEYIPITTYEVTKDFEELQFESQITNREKGSPLYVEVRIIKYPTDNNPALRMSAPTYMLNRIQMNGIDYNKAEVIFKQNREFESGDEVFTYRVGYEVPEIGNYRYEISATNQSTERTLTRAFDFGVKRAGFPFVRSIHDLIDPLVYLMDPKEFKSLKALSSEDSIKKEIDDFWIRNIRNERKARELINLYYERVEEANKYFSSYKAGWKTDIGMIYILFGPPMYSYDTYNYIHWSYTSDRYDPRTNYYFNKERRQSRVFPFVVYQLDRTQPQLRENEYLILDKWLNGNILY